MNKTIRRYRGGVKHRRAYITLDYYSKASKQGDERDIRDRLTRGTFGVIFTRTVTRVHIRNQKVKR